MLLAENVLTAAQQTFSSESGTCGAPPSSELTLAIKRQRVADCSKQQQWVSPHSQAQQSAHAWAPQPPTPAATAPRVQQPAARAVPWQASYLLDYVHRCLDALSAMHPVCAFIRTHTKAAELSCAIFRRAYLSRPPAERATLLRERFLAQALLAGSLWIAVKWEATRSTTPDANIMSQISGIPSNFLRQQEADILAVLRWQLMGVAREVGAVGAPDLSDAPALDQQAQLAALAQPPVLLLLPEVEAPSIAALPSLKKELLEAPGCCPAL